MTANANSARLLTTNQDVALAHKVANVLEADSALVHLAAVFGADAVDHAGGVEGAYDFARPLLALQEPFKNQGKDLVRVDEAAIFRDCAETVGVAVGGESRLAVSANDGLLQKCDVGKDRLGVDAGKRRVDFTPNFDVFNPSFGEDALQDSATRAVHGVDGELEVRLLNHVEVDKLLQRRDVGSLEVGKPNPPAVAFDRRRVEGRLDQLDDRGRR